MTISDHASGIKEWFKRAEIYLIKSKFNSGAAYDQAIKKVQQAKERLAKAEDHLRKDEQDEALAIWKELFGSVFKVLDLGEARSFSSALREGTLRVAGPGVLSTAAGRAIPASSGYFGSTTNE
ncbi:MAG: hypothetical protein IPH53_16520 [Flavobacteriales bacterium]|nr:hypothetical protein [Flavobacteriales bacterium]